MATKTFLMIYDYDEKEGDTLPKVFNINLENLDKRIINAMSTITSFSASLIEMMNSKKITGSELLFLATVGFKTLIEDIKRFSVFTLGIDDLRKKLAMLPPDIQEQLIEQLPKEIRQKFKNSALEKDDDDDDDFDEPLD